MLILGSLLALSVGGWALSWRARSYSDLEEVSGFVSFISSLVLVFALCTVPIHQMAVRANIEEYQSVQQTIRQAREGKRVERAAFQMKVAEMNQWRASVKYWNGTVFDLWVPDAVERLDSIK